MDGWNHVSVSEPQAPTAFFVVRWLSIDGPLLVEPPYTTGLVALDASVGTVENADHPRQAHEELVLLLVDALEEPSLPLAALLLLDLAQLTLGVLDLRLGGRGGLHVAALDGARDVVPGPATLVEVLLLQRRDSQRGRLHVGDGVGLHFLLRPGVLDDEGVGPLPVDSVQGLLLPVALLVEDGVEGVLLSAEPALARVFDLGDVAG